MSYLELSAADIKIPHNSVNVPNTPLNSATWQTAIAATFVVIGMICVLFIIIGGVRYVTSNGDQSQIVQAKNTILYAVVGLVLSIMSFTIVQFVIGVF